MFVFTVMFEHVALETQQLAHNCSDHPAVELVNGASEASPSTPLGRECQKGASAVSPPKPYAATSFQYPPYYMIISYHTNII